MRFRSLLSAAAVVVLAAQGSPGDAHASDGEIHSLTQVTDITLLTGQAPIVGLGDLDTVDTYVVLLKEEPTLAYRGTRPGLQAVPRDGRGRPDLRSEGARNYRANLRRGQDAVISNTQERISRDPEVVHRYTETLNGFAVRVTGSEAREFARDGAVQTVVRAENHAIATYAGPGWVGAPGVWNGPSGLASKGEGTLVGIIDTGVNPTSPSFAAVDPTDGYQHVNPYGSGNFKGVCNPAHPQYQPTYQCNDKLVGAYYFLSAWGTFPNQGAFDENGHGSHVAGTAAGNNVTITFNGATVDLSGVAPRANVISYRVCGGPNMLCNTADSAAAIDQAVLDGVDALNFSIGGGTNPAGDLASLAFLRAADAGVFVAAAAGNFNPNFAGSSSHRGGWMTTVASVTHNGIIAHPVSVTGPAPIAGAPQGLGGIRGTGPVMHDVGITTIGTGSQGKGQGQQHGQGVGLNQGKTEYRWAGNVGNTRGCTPFAAGTFAGAVALIERGDCDFVVKVNNATAAGAVAVVVYNNAPGLPIVMGALETTTVPAVMVSRPDGLALVDWLTTHGVAHLSIKATAQVALSDEYGDIMAASSGRGPVGNILKPDVAAPGASVLAAYTPNPDSYAQIGGTSMASPHVAGAGLLLRALHPTWSPLEIKSALMTTGRHAGVRKSDAVTPADAYDIGGGRINIDRAARVGLVMHETRANFEAGNAGMNLANLNLAAFANQNCNGTCSWTRTVRSTRASATTWTVTASSLTPGLTVSATPSISVGPGGTATFSVTANTSGMAVGSHGFFEVVLTDSSGQSPDQRMAGAVQRPAPIQQGSYVVATNATDASCAMPFANQGGYVDLAAFGIALQPFAGDTIGINAFAGGVPIFFHGASYIDGLQFREDGFAFLRTSGVDAGPSPWANRPIPSSGNPRNFVAPLWHDWELVFDPAADRGARFATSGTTWIIADFRRVQAWGNPSQTLSYQVAMRRAPALTPGLWDIVFAYNHVNATTHLAMGATIGLENLFGDQGVQFAFNDANLNQVVNGRAICFRWVPAN